MKQITRTIETHTIYASAVEMKDGQLITTDLPSIEVSNTSMNSEKALKLVQKEYGKNQQYVIRAVDTKQKTYGIDFNKFMEFAKVIE